MKNSFSGTRKLNKPRTIRSDRNRGIEEIKRNFTFRRIIQLTDVRRCQLGNAVHDNVQRVLLNIKEAQDVAAVGN